MHTERILRCFFFCSWNLETVIEIWKVQRGIWVQKKGMAFKFAQWLLD